MDSGGGEAAREIPAVRALSFHANYRCENTGVCCSSGWEIAVEMDVEVRLTALLAGAPGHLPNGPDGFRLMADPPTRCESSLRKLDSTGACWFRDDPGRACAIHRNHGEAVLPSACRQFPKVCVLEPGVVSVSLSHYCPTAAGLLFGPPTDFRLVSDPGAFPGDWPFEGLDARDAYPPFLRPGVLLGFDGLRTFEDQAVAVLAGEALGRALAILESAVEGVRSWTMEAGPLCELMPGAFARAAREATQAKTQPRATDPRAVLLSAVTAGTTPNAELPDFRAASTTVSALADLALRKYLASRLIAAWIAFQGDDLRQVVRYLRLCLDTVLLFESARSPAESDAIRWKEAIRSTDLWILHHCDPELLARNLR